MRLRQYQEEAIQAVIDYWSRGGGNPVVEAATGLGKSVMIAKFIRQLSDEYPNVRILMMTHQMELIEQNYKTLLRVWPEAPAGIYNASLGRKDFRQKIIFGSIQSVANAPELLAPRHIVIIDEAHLVSPNDATRYQKVLRVLQKKFDGVRVCGFTATPYRLGSGSLVGDGQIFDEIVYRYNIADGIRDGWLTPVVACASPKASIDLSNVAVRGGEFIEKELQEAAGDPVMIQAACEDLLKRTSDRSSVLVFCSGIAHASAVAECLRLMMQEAETVTGNTAPERRAQLIDDFKNKRLRFLTNANVLTTGFDAPDVDAIALMRPTLSTSLYVQMIGRGTRITETLDINSYATPDERRNEIGKSTKPNCLVLDYAGNLKRHGPVNLVEGTVVKVGRNTVSENVRDCLNPDCMMTHDVASWEHNAWRCPSCNGKKCRSCKEWTDHELWDGGIGFNICPKCSADQSGMATAKRRPDHATEADIEEVIIAEVPKKNWHTVLDWEWNVHSKKKFNPDATDTLRVTYYCSSGLKFQEWLCFDHPKGSYPYKIAQKWWVAHGGWWETPNSVEEAIERFQGSMSEGMAMPSCIAVQKDGKYDRITDSDLDHRSTRPLNYHVTGRGG